MDSEKTDSEEIFGGKCVKADSVETNSEEILGEGGQWRFEEIHGGEYVKADSDEMNSEKTGSKKIVNVNYVELS